MTIAIAQSFLARNPDKAVIVCSMRQSRRLRTRCATRPVRDRDRQAGPSPKHIAENLAPSLMLVTALNPLISYDYAVCIRKLVQVEAKTQMQAGEPLSWVLQEAAGHRVVVARAGLPLDGGSG